jgi:hypothetical protein
MEEVYHSKSLSMGFCLECHREPEKALRPMGEVTNLSWAADILASSLPNDSAHTDVHAGLDIKQKWGVNPPLSCTGCHR